MHTTIEKWGDDYRIPLPQDLLDQMGLSEDDSLDIEIADDVNILRKAGASGNDCQD